MNAADTFLFRTRRSASTLGRATALSCLLAALSPSAHAANWIVQVGGAGGLAYNPSVLTIDAGDTVRFANLGGYHNVTADNGAFRCARGCDNDGQGGSGSASSQIWTATVAFPDAGQYGYFCEPHGSPGKGMFGMIIVRGIEPPVAVPAGGRAYLAALAVLLFAATVLRVRQRSRDRLR